ncbi:MAG: DNA repair protein RecN [Candidatus Omnitrophica bacterium]|nr:DNA repair protein RecN [Candidatus Omnitrophota bacterium]
MISQITIKNFGLIEKISLELCKGLNVFTGETGVGKSILIDALRFCLGNRLNKTQMRNPDQACIVEIELYISASQLKELSLFSDYISEEDPTLIIHRTCLPDGKNKIKVNGFSLTVSQLKEIGNYLLDFHGPHDHQMLLSQENHITMLDRLCNMADKKNTYDIKYQEYLKTLKELNKLQTISKNRDIEQDILEHQLKEIEQISFDENIYQELLHERKRLNNTETLFEHAREILNILENDESGLSNFILKAFPPLKSLNQIDETTSNFTEILCRIQEDSSDLLSNLTNYMESISFDPGTAEEINRRYNIYYDILKKYGPTLEDVKKFYTASKEKYECIVNLEHTDLTLKNSLKLLLTDLKIISKKLSLKRKNTAKILKKTIEVELKELGIKHIQFECRIEDTEINSCGQDKVTFYISPNAGEGLKPLAEIVSSGEAARLMLALKKALTKVDPIPVLIFDEIDAQIGGRLGTITGKKLKELSNDRQVILITHLPQIASFGDYHFKVLKSIENNRTITKVSLLDAETRINELAKMMSGEKESQIAIKHAKDLIAKANS